MSNGAMGQTSGIVTRRYKHGSIVYFENDKSEYIYILKGGRVILTSLKVDTGEEVKEEIKPGEFFGVKSSLGKYPREETAQTIGETVLLVLTLADFERLVLQNVNVVRKMLRIFSNQLRRIGKSQREVLGESESINPAEELFKIGEYYFKVGRVQQAQYAYKRYMEYYPDGKYSGPSMQRIRAIESGSAGGGDDLPPVGPAAPPSAPMRGDGNVDFTDFSIDGEKPAVSAPSRTPLDDFGVDAASSSSLTSEMDDFFSEGKSVDFEGDPFSGGDMNEKGGKGVAENFYAAMSRFSQEDYAGALALYSGILDVRNLKNDSEAKIFEKAHFEIGRCYLKLAKFSEALTSFSNMIKKFPGSENVKNALFHMGVVYESVKKADKAAAYYNRVIPMEPRDSINKLAAKRLKAIENG
ncbi:MAG TPA: cyclic nucleotide-binding domain-containing protein [Spirochaetota bacterium]|nr:cyclic nucleotide-binding domain-containing protein [Spirochaetota bacterium]